MDSVHSSLHSHSIGTGDHTIRKTLLKEMTGKEDFGPEHPEWWKEGDLDASLVSQALDIHQVCASAKLEPFDHYGGAVANLSRLIVIGEGKERTTFIVKRLPDSALPRSLELGLTRESDFFMWFKHSPLAKKLYDAPDGVVRCEYATHDETTGQKVCVLQDLSGAQEGRWLMMRSHPLCANDDIPTLTANGPSQLQATKASFQSLARFHGTFWDPAIRKELLQLPWVAGSKWIQGEDRASWEQEQSIAQQNWAQCKEAIANGTSTIEWSDKVVELLDASISKIDWDAARTQLEQEALTLCHGDFWPANVLFKDNDTPVMVDWELVRLGSGRQDIAQFMVNMDIDFRRKHEKDLVRAYVDELNKTMPKSEQPVSLEETLEGYAYSGAAKLCWMLPLMVGFGHDFGKFFHDITEAWFEDFSFTAETIPQPRL